MSMEMKDTMRVLRWHDSEIGDVGQMVMLSSRRMRSNQLRSSIRWK